MTIACESCGKVVLNARTRQRFCRDCAKERQKAAALRYRIKHCEEIKEQSRLRAQMRRILERESKARKRTPPPPKYTIVQVDAKAKELGISYGKCNLLLEQGKITI